MRRETLAFGLGLILFWGCSDDPGLAALDGVLEVEPLLDFGAVQVGLAAHEIFSLNNGGNGAVLIEGVEPGANFNSAQHQFEAPREAISLGAGETKTIEISFLPLAEGVVESSINFKVTGTDPVT